MKKETHYQAHTPDANGIIHYTDEENSIWKELYARQIKGLPNHACDEFQQGLDDLSLAEDKIPQAHEVNAVLMERTDWSVAPVPALISFDRFFHMLANKQFPAASFIRSRDEFDYLREPDIFHELFGHATMLVHPAFADFVQAYGKAGVIASKQNRVLLARLFWFTVEFGLLKSPVGNRSYGGGINSSPGELKYAINDHVAEHREFNILDVLRTPYRIDIYQPIYYVMNDLDHLYELASTDLSSLYTRARELGDFEPTFPAKQAAS